MSEGREAHLRALRWQTIRSLSADEARAALLQAMADIDEHWAKEHSGDGLPEDLGIPPDEYLTSLVARTRAAPPITE